MTSYVGNYLLPSFLSKLRRLRSLVFDRGDFGTSGIAALGVWRGTILSELTYLGVTCEIKKKRSGPWTLDDFKLILGRELFPELKVVRLLSEANPSSPGFTWRDAVELSNKRGVRLEDKWGKQIHEEPEL